MGDGRFTANLAAAIYDECITIWLGFQKISIEHCRRETNQVAHELAKKAMISKIYCIWDDDPPSFIVDLLSNDVTFLDQ